MHRVLVVCLILLFFFGSIFAQEPHSPVVIEQEELKKKEPQLYKEKRDTLERQGKIGAIITAFRKGEISSPTAASKLNPLLKQEIEDEVSKLESEIASLGKKLESLREAKANPEPLIKKRINQMLDEAILTPDKLMKKTPGSST